MCSHISLVSKLREKHSSLLNSILLYDLLTNIRLGQNCMLEVNTLTYRTYPHSMGRLNALQSMIRL
jgi:hypothetical protein